MKRDWGALKPFQHTAARRRLAVCQFRRRRDIVFQHTAARRRLGPENAGAFSVSSFNTQPPEGGWKNLQSKTYLTHRFNTQPPEGGWQESNVLDFSPKLFQHTAARRRLGLKALPFTRAMAFQHTAARRRLAYLPDVINPYLAVSTHSRPKAAGPESIYSRSRHQCFNTQPPEGGWRRESGGGSTAKRFNTQPPEGGWD